MTLSGSTSDLSAKLRVSIKTNRSGRFWKIRTKRPFLISGRWLLEPTTTCCLRKAIAASRQGGKPRRRRICCATEEGRTGHTHRNLPLVMRMKSSAFWCSAVHRPNREEVEIYPRRLSIVALLQGKDQGRSGLPDTVPDWFQYPPGTKLSPNCEIAECHREPPGRTAASLEARKNLTVQYEFRNLPPNLSHAFSFCSLSSRDIFVLARAYPCRCRQYIEPISKISHPL